jgi:hypothetical protein
MIRNPNCKLWGSEVPKKMGKMITVVFWVFLKTLFMMLWMTLKDRESNAKIMMVIFIMSGHVPRNMRVALNMIDLAAPYIHLNKFEVDKKNLIEVQWKIGGTFNID